MSLFNNYEVMFVVPAARKAEANSRLNAIFGDDADYLTTEVILANDASNAPATHYLLHAWMNSDQLRAFNTTGLGAAKATIFGQKRDVVIDRVQPAATKRQNPLDVDDELGNDNLKRRPQTAP